MRFKAKLDFGIAAYLIVFIAAFLLITGLGFARTGSREFAFSFLSTCVAIAVASVWVFPQYCDVREDGLFVRQGRHVSELIPYDSLVALRPYQSMAKSWVISMDRILVVTTLPEPALDRFHACFDIFDPGRAEVDGFGSGRRFVITAAEQQLFLSEVYLRCPRLNSDLGASLEATRIAAPVGCRRRAERPRPLLEGAEAVLSDSLVLVAVAVAAVEALDQQVQLLICL